MTEVQTSLLNIRYITRKFHSTGYIWKSILSMKNWRVIKIQNVKKWRHYQNNSSKTLRKTLPHIRVYEVSSNDCPPSLGADVVWQQEVTPLWHKRKKNANICLTHLPLYLDPAHSNQRPTWACIPFTIKTVLKIK